MLSSTNLKFQCILNESLLSANTVSQLDSCKPGTLCICIVLSLLPYVFYQPPSPPDLSTWYATFFHTWTLWCKHIAEYLFKKIWMFQSFTGGPGFKETAQTSYNSISCDYLNKMNMKYKWFEDIVMASIPNVYLKQILKNLKITQIQNMSSPIQFILDMSILLLVVTKQW